MKFSEGHRKIIFRKTDGRCHLCGKGIKFSKYGRAGPANKGAWEIDHSNAKANGGTDSMNNLLPAHATCNRRKGAKTNKIIRHQHGLSRKPMSQEEKEEHTNSNMMAGVIAGGIIGARFGLPGAAIGATIGLLLGSSDPEGSG